MGEESEASDWEGWTQLVKAGSRNRGAVASHSSALDLDLDDDDGNPDPDAFLVRPSATRLLLSTPARSWPSPSFFFTPPLAPPLPSWVVMRAVRSSPLPLFGLLFTRVPDRTVCSNGDRSNRFNVIGAHSSEDGCVIPPVVVVVGGGGNGGGCGGAGSWEREEEAMPVDGVE